MTDCTRLELILRNLKAAHLLDTLILSNYDCCTKLKHIVTCLNDRIIALNFENYTTINGNEYSVIPEGYLDI
jgi:hypothetical protein